MATEDPISDLSAKIAAEAAEAALAQNYSAGMTDGTLCLLDLLLGENDCERLAPEQFEAMRFKGEIAEDLREWLQRAHDRAVEHRRALGDAPDPGAEHG
jgi:hypothetical protein